MVLICKNKADLYYLTYTLFLNAVGKFRIKLLNIFNYYFHRDMLLNITFPTHFGSVLKVINDFHSLCTYQFHIKKKTSKFWLIVCYDRIYYIIHIFFIIWSPSRKFQCRKYCLSKTHHISRPKAIKTRPYPNSSKQINKLNLKSRWQDPTTNFIKKREAFLSVPLPHTLGGRTPPKLMQRGCFVGTCIP